MLNAIKQFKKIANDSNTRTFLMVMFHEVLSSVAILNSYAMQRSTDCLALFECEREDHVMHCGMSVWDCAQQGSRACVCVLCLGLEYVIAPTLTVYLVTPCIVYVSFRVLLSTFRSPVHCFSMQRQLITPLTLSGKCCLR